jgi:hypothetical protein
MGKQRSTRKTSPSSLPLATSSSLRMDFSTPWVPALKGRVLPACSVVADLVDNRINPNPSVPKEAAWSVAKIREEVGGFPNLKEAFFECATAIWRLQKTLSQGEGDPIWEDHLEAWLVSGVVEARKCGALKRRSSLGTTSSVGRRGSSR